MEIPVQVTFRDVPPSETVRQLCVKEASKLERYFDRITSCRVVVAAPHRQQKKGTLYSVRVDLTVPGKEIVVNRDNHENHAHEDCTVAVRDAFRATRRQLEGFVERRRGAAKLPDAAPSARVFMLETDHGVGVLVTADGREIRFGREAVAEPGFDKLEVGAEVRYTEAEGEDGPVASEVRLVGS